MHAVLRNNFSIVFILIPAVLQLQACAGEAGANGTSAVLGSTVEPPGEECPNGGTRVGFGVDVNGNGALDADETAGSTVVCNGAPGETGASGGAGEDGATGADGAAGSDGEDGATALVTTTTEEPGTDCPAGGVRIETGVDENGNDVLDADEIDDTARVCNAPAVIPSLVSVTAVPEGDLCAAGGQVIETGLDTDSDGNLDTGETQNASVVCNGETGSDAIEWRVVTEAATNADCAEGGSVILSGPDSDRSGDLSEIEIVTRTPICNGGSAAELQAFIVSSSTEAAGTTCATGGVRIDSGYDADGSGGLNGDEIVDTAYVCNGARGADGTDGVDGVDGVDGADGEDGADGADGEDGATGADGASTLALVVEIPAGTTCAAGGQQLTVYTDANGNNSLDASETSTSFNVCNGVDGIDGVDGENGIDGTDGADGADGEDADALLFSSTVILPGTVCETGGSSLAVGYDLDNNGVLAETEIVSRTPVCNGEPGDLFSARPVVQAFSPFYSIPLNETRNISELDLVAAVAGYAVVSATFSVVCSESSTNPCAPVGGSPSWSFILTSLNNNSETGVPSISGPYGPEYRETVQTTRVFPIAAGTTRYRLFGRNSNGGLALRLENVTLVAQFIPAGG